MDADTLPADAGPLSATWAFDPCRHGPSTGAPVAGRELVQSGLEARRVRQVAVYGTAAEARRVFRGFGEAARRCTRVALGDDAHIDWDRPPGDPLGPAALDIFGRQRQAGLPTTAGAHQLAVRIHNVIVVAASQSEFGDPAPPDYPRRVAELRRATSELITGLCVHVYGEPCLAGAALDPDGYAGVAGG